MCCCLTLLLLVLSRLLLRLLQSLLFRYGVWGDWDRPYITLQPEYEAAQLQVFGEMFLKGHIYR